MASRRRLFQLAVRRAPGLFHHSAAAAVLRSICVAERPLSGVLAHPGNWERAEFLVLFSEMEIRVSLLRVLCLFSEMGIRDSLQFALNKTLFE